MEFHSEKLKNPEFFCENRLPAHSDHEAFACLEDLEAGENRLRMSLNGYWKFFYAVNEKQLIPGFEQPEYDCADWADVAVPAHVQLEGYGVPSTATPSTHGTAGRILSRAKFPSVSTRWHAM